jgi:carbon storage regulator
VLVLSRKRDQKIMVGSQICLTVVDIKGDTVQLGIDAPRKIPIYREEIYTAIVLANEEAMKKEDSIEKDLGGIRPPGESQALDPGDSED